MWELDPKEGLAPKNWYFWTVVLQKTLESPLKGLKEIKPVSSQRNQSWIFIGRTDGEAEAPILWPPDSKSQHSGKDSDAQKDWRKEDKGTTEHEMIGCYHRVNGREFEQLRETVEDTEAWQGAVHGVAKSQTWLSNWTTTTLLSNVILEAESQHRGKIYITEINKSCKSRLCPQRQL